MRAIAAAFCILILSSTEGSSQAGGPPRFRDYPMSNIYRGKVKAPSFGNLDKYEGTDVRCYGGKPSAYSAEPVNFAGHFVISACSCATGCHYLFMWDAISGKVYLHFPFGPINVGLYGVGVIDPPIEYKGEQYKVDSSLLIVEGCVEGTCDCATRYYNWDGKRLKLLLRQTTRMPPECQK
jgi:hypothetical protein